MNVITLAASAPGAPIIPVYPWKGGDTLYASALNAAIANAPGGGPYVPTSYIAINIKSYGAKVDGVTDDSAAYAQARTAAQALSTNGEVEVPPGKQYMTVGPPFVSPPVLWKLNGVTYADGVTPVAEITYGDLVQNFYGGSVLYERTDATLPAGSSIMRMNYIGPGSSFGVLNISTTTTSPTAFQWGIVVQQTLNQSGSGETVGIASTTNRTTGGNPGFCFYGQAVNMTGLSPSGNQQDVAQELDLFNSGPDIANSYFDPSQGSRLGLSVIAKTAPLNAWAASTAYSLNTAIAPGNGYTYRCTTAGTSGGTAPTWPTSAGTVADGTAVWTFGTTVNNQVSRGMDIGSYTASSSMGAAIRASGRFYDAILEFSAATLDTTTNIHAAGIRLAANMPIDFSGNATAAGQNNHTLSYNSSTTRLEYVISGTTQVGITDGGVLQGLNGITAGNGGSGSTVTLNAGAAVPRLIQLQSNGSLRWRIYATGVGEGGSNAGSDLTIDCWNDAGSGYIAAPLTITRATGLATVAGDPTAALGVVTKQYVDARTTGLASTLPLMDGTAAVGTSTLTSRQDHVHPSDTSRLALTGGTLTGALTAPGYSVSGSPGTFYLTYASSQYQLQWGSWIDYITSGGVRAWWSGTAIAMQLSTAGALTVQSGFAVFNGTPPAAKPTVTGAKGGNAALASLLAALVSYGLITDSSTA